MLRDNKENFKRRVRENVEQSKRDIPEGFVMPTSQTSAPVEKEVEVDDGFWNDSEDEFSDFGADSDEDMTFGEFTRGG